MNVDNKQRLCPDCGEPMVRLYKRAKSVRFGCLTKNCSIIEIRVGGNGQERVIRQAEYRPQVVI